MVLQSSTACDFGAQADICEDFASTFYTAGAQSVLEQGIREHDTPEHIAQRMEAVRRALIRD